MRKCMPRSNFPRKMNDDNTGFVLAEHDAQSIAEHAASAEAAGFLHPAQQA